MTERKFKGIWIPKELWFDDELSPHEKIMILEIDSLDKKGDGCYASNRFLAKKLNLSRGRVANILTKLRKENIIVDKKRFDGRKRFIRIAKWVKELYKI